MKVYMLFNVFNLKTYNLNFFLIASSRTRPERVKCQPKTDLNLTCIKNDSCQPGPTVTMRRVREFGYLTQCRINVELNDLIY